MSRTTLKANKHVVLSAFSMTIQSHFSREMVADTLNISEQEVDEILNNKRDVWDKYYCDEREDISYYEPTKAIQVYIPIGARKPRGCDDVQSEDGSGLYPSREEELPTEMHVSFLGNGRVSAPTVRPLGGVLDLLHSENSVACQAQLGPESLPLSPPGRGWTGEGCTGSDPDGEGEPQVREGAEAWAYTE